MDRERRWRELARQLRADAVRATAAAGSRHPTSALSAADLMAVLLDGHLRYDFADPAHPGNDHLIFSKGHAAPLLYAMFKAAGAISDEELLRLRKLGSPLEGHPTPLPLRVKVIGSLDETVTIPVGIALGARRLGWPSPIWVLCGNGEMAEGTRWEAFEVLLWLERPAKPAREDLLGSSATQARGSRTAADSRDSRLVARARRARRAVAKRLGTVIRRWWRKAWKWLGGLAVVLGLLQNVDWLLRSFVWRQLLEWLNWIMKRMLEILG
jgi:Transketolase, thiamine diphosphate binding domain